MLKWVLALRLTRFCLSSFTVSPVGKRPFRCAVQGQRAHRAEMDCGRADKVLDETQRILAERMSDTEVASVLRAAQSQFQLTLSQILRRARPPPPRYSSGNIGRVMVEPAVQAVAPYSNAPRSGALIALSVTPEMTMPALISGAPDTSWKLSPEALTKLLALAFSMLWSIVTPELAV